MPGGRRYRWVWMMKQCLRWRPSLAAAASRKCRRRSVFAQVTWMRPRELRQQHQEKVLGFQEPARARSRRKSKRLRRSSSSTLETIPEEAEELRIFFFPDLWTACMALGLNREQVSQRGSSSMYRGTMEQQQVVSVRILSQDLCPAGHEVEAWLAWLADVRGLSKIQHPNWVKLLAYCLVEKSNHHILVYEALPSMSLQSRLLDRRLSPLPWSARMKIAVGAARCLAHLHQQEWSGPDRPKLLCGNLNAHTLLLDRNYSPKLFFVKLSDEWPLRFTIQDDSPAAQTAFRRYLRAHFSKEMDVFNFGLLLFQLLAGRHRKTSSADWVRPAFQGCHKSSGKSLSQLVDKRLQGRFSSRAAKEVAALAFRCISPENGERPSMCEVVQIVERAQTMS